MEEELRRGLIGGGHAGDIFYSTVQAATDFLPADVEMIIYKIYLYLKSYTVRVETLKEFCGFIEREFEMMFGYAQTR
jgi:hypothetical protein